MDRSGQYLMKVFYTQVLMNTHPALEGRQAVSADVALRQCLHQLPRLLQVCSVKTLGEPAIDRCEQVVGRGALALLLPQAGQAHGGAQLQGFRLLAAGDLQGALEAGFRLLWLWHRLPQEQDAPQATDLRFPP